MPFDLLTLTVWLARLSGLLVVAGTLWTLRSKPESGLRGFRNPVLSVELVETGQDLQRIAKCDAWKKKITGALPLDNWLFIPAYCLIFVLLGASLAWQASPLQAALGVGVCLSVLVAGGCDYLENANTARPR